MKIFNTGTLTQESIARLAHSQSSLWVYNGLDAAITREVYDSLRNKISPQAKLSYDFVRAMQGPALTMMRRGIKVHVAARERLHIKMLNEMLDLQSKLDLLANAVWDRGLNPMSPKQLQEFFYRTMNIPKIRVNSKGVSKVSTNLEALEKIRTYFHARAFVELILAIRDIKKKLNLIEAGIDEDSRMRVSYNVVGTVTGRWSSSKNVYGRGTNMQNITEKLRDIFIPDIGFELIYADLEQAEARIVAYLSGDENYIKACESGDLHTAVARMVWPELPWTGDLKHDKILAETPFYRHLSYRDSAKRVAHGSNYFGKPPQLAKVLRVPVGVMVKAQQQYFRAFPGIVQWHRNIARQLATNKYIDTPLGRRRFFFGRTWDDSVLREAIAHGPQSTVGELLNLGLWRLWKTHEPRIQILAQIHDAVLAQYPLDEKAEAVRSVRAALTIPFQINNHTVVIPVEIKTGFNWGKVSKENPRGLSKYVEAVIPKLA